MMRAGSLQSRLPRVGIGCVDDEFRLRQLVVAVIIELHTGTPDPALHRLHTHALVRCDLGVTELRILTKHDDNPKLFGEKEKSSPDHITVDHALGERRFAGDVFVPEPFVEDLTASRPHDSERRIACDAIQPRSGCCCATESAEILPRRDQRILQCILGVVPVSCDPDADRPHAFP